MIDAERGGACGAGGFALGEHSYVGPQCLINTDDDVRIGDRSALGPRCMVFTHGSFLPFLEGYPVRLAPVSVGDRGALEVDHDLALVARARLAGRAAEAGPG